MYIFLSYLIFVNILTFIFYGVDKWKAKHHKWRISEACLLLLAVIGGSLGALLGIYGFRHKTKHKKFTIGVPVILVLQICILFWLEQKMGSILL